MIAMGPEPGLPIRLCTVEEARDLTDRIKATAERLWALLLEAHERRAWSALGYERWEDYVRGEFDMSRRRSYQLLDQAEVIRQISAASVCTDVHITEAEARDLKPVLPRLVEDVRERVQDVEPERVPEVVRQVVSETRERVREEHRPRTDVPGVLGQVLTSADRAARAAEEIERRHLASKAAEAAVWRDSLGRSIQALQRLHDLLTEASQ